MHETAVPTMIWCYHNANQGGTADVRKQTAATDDSPIKIMVVPANEELIIARETVRLLKG